MGRRDAMERVTAVGYDFKTNVSKHLDYLVIGDGDFVQFVDGWCWRLVRIADDGYMYPTTTAPVASLKNKEWVAPLALKMYVPSSVASQGPPPQPE